MGKDAEMSREFSLVWDMVVRSSALKYTGAFVDMGTSGGGEIAANASVIKVEGSTVKKPVGTPSVIAYFVQGAYAEPYAKVVLRDMNRPVLFLVARVRIARAVWAETL